MKWIYDEVNKLIEKFDENNPFVLAELLKVKIRYFDLGSLKGYYRYEDRNSYIVLNTNLDQYERKIVCGHELAHHILHLNRAKCATLFKETKLYDLSSKDELEANIFASELLIDDDAVNELVYEYDFYSVANSLYMPPNFLAIKLYSMNKRGYKFNIPIDVKGDFLKS